MPVRLKRSVTFTRTGDVDLSSLPDPATLPARVVSPAQALHGRYHISRTFSRWLSPQQEDQAVTTDCLRTGDRCMSYFHSPSTDTPLVFSAGDWMLNVEHADNRCRLLLPGSEDHRGVSAAAIATGSHPSAHRARSPRTDRVLRSRGGFRRNICAHWRLAPDDTGAR